MQEWHLHSVIIDGTASLSPGDFGVHPYGGCLCVPRELDELMRTGMNNPLRHPLVLPDFILTFPTALRLRLGWSEEEFAEAKDRLWSYLQSVMPDELLHPAPRPKRAYGALPPPSRVPPSYADA